MTGTITKLEGNDGVIRVIRGRVKALLVRLAFYPRFALSSVLFVHAPG